MISLGHAYYHHDTFQLGGSFRTYPAYKNMIVNSLNYCIANKGLQVNS